MLSVLLRFTASGYPFGIFKLFLCGDVKYCIGLYVLSTEENTFCFVMLYYVSLIDWLLFNSKGPVFQLFL